MRLSLILITLLTLATSLSAKKQKTDSDYCRRIYIFGMSTSFNDSIAYITDVQCLDSAYLEQGKFLGGRKQYSAQLDNHFFNQGKERVCCIFFSTKQKKAEKQYLKLRKRYNKPKYHTTLKPLTKQEFVFTNVRPDYDEDQMPAAPKKEKKKHDKPQGAPDGKRPPMGGPGGMGASGGMGGRM